MLRTVSAFRASIVLRLLAALFVCLIVADLAAEGHCDGPLAPARSLSALSPATATTDDACDQACVPDCYCCAGGVEHATVIVLIEAEPADRAVAPAPPSVPNGVRPLPYHPPLTA